MRLLEALEGNQPPEAAGHTLGFMVSFLRLLVLLLVHGLLSPSSEPALCLSPTFLRGHTAPLTLLSPSATFEGPFDSIRLPSESRTISPSYLPILTTFAKSLLPHNGVK